MIYGSDRKNEWKDKKVVNVVEIDHLIHHKKATILF